MFNSFSNASLTWRGTTLLPRHLILSTLRGNPSTTLPTEGSTAQKSLWQQGLDLEVRPVGMLVPLRPVCPDSPFHSSFSRIDNLPCDLGWLVWARRNHLSLRCLAPTEEAVTVVQRISYPSEASVLHTVSAPRVRIAGTFSRKRKEGRSSSASLATSKNKPLRSPAKPLPSPPILRS